MCVNRQSCRLVTLFCFKNHYAHPENLISLKDNHMYRVRILNALYTSSTSTVNQSFSGLVPGLTINGVTSTFRNKFTAFPSARDMSASTAKPKVLVSRIDIPKAAMKLLEDKSVYLILYYQTNVQCEPSKKPE